MIDTDMAEQILQGDDTHPDILQALGLEILDNYEKLLRQSRRLVAHAESLIYTLKDQSMKNYRMKELVKQIDKTNDLMEE